jgi:rSAM/selenodomain-associated transferase 2
MIGVVIPTLDEADSLPLLLDDLRRLVVPLDIVVADGGSSDGTPAVARAAGAHLVAAPRGRARQLNAGADAARGEWLLFLHADCRLPPPARRALLAAAVDDPGARAAVFRFAIDLPPPGKGFIERGQRLRQALFRLPYGDQGLLLSRELFHAVGGFPDIPIMEDVEMIRRLGRRRVEVRTLPAPLLTSGRRYRERGVVRTWLQHTALISLYLAGVSPGRLARLRRAGPSPSSDS